MVWGEWCLGVKLGGTRGVFSRGGQVGGGQVVWMATAPGGPRGAVPRGIRMLSLLFLTVVFLRNPAL